MASDPSSAGRREILYGSVKTIYHTSPRLFDTGMGPQEERLLLALVGGGVALIVFLTLFVVCCRNYKLAGMRPARWSQHRHMTPMHYPYRYPFQSGHLLQCSGFYYPSQFYQTAAAPGITLVDPRLLDPGMTCVVNSGAATSSVTGSAAVATASMASQLSGGASGASAKPGTGLIQGGMGRQRPIIRQQRTESQRLPLVGSFDAVV